MGAQAAEKGIQVRNTGFAAGNWRCSAPKSLGRTWAQRRTRWAQLVRPSRRPSPGSPPAPRPALPRPQRAHPPPARLTRRPSLSDQAAAVPTAEARPPTAAASPRAHRLRRRADPRGLGAGPASPRRGAPPTPPPNGGRVPAPRPRPTRARDFLWATPQPAGHALHRLPSRPTCGVRSEGSPWARGRVDPEARSGSHPPVLANKKMDLTSWSRPQTTAASLGHASARSPRPRFPTACGGFWGGGGESGSVFRSDSRL